MKTDDLDNSTCLLSLGGKTCPACGGKKRPRQTLCVGDWNRLPRAEAMALYRKIGKGYREAVQAALHLLKVEEVRLGQTEAAPAAE